MPPIELKRISAPERNNAAVAHGSAPFLAGAAVGSVTGFVVGGMDDTAEGIGNRIDGMDQGRPLIGGRSSAEEAARQLRDWYAPDFKLEFIDGQPINIPNLPAQAAIEARAADHLTHTQEAQAEIVGSAVILSTVGVATISAFAWQRRRKRWYVDRRRDSPNP